MNKPVKARSTVDAVVPLPAPLVGTYGDATPGVDYETFPTKTLTYAKGSRVRSIAITDNDIDLFLANND